MNTVDVLRDAKAILSDEASWGRAKLVCDRTGRVCALGAIAKVAQIPLYEDDIDPYDVLLAHPAVVALGAVLPPRHNRRVDRADERVYEFNDEAHRANHHAKLIDAFDRAILSLSTDTKVEPLPERVEIPA